MSRVRVLLNCLLILALIFGFSPAQLAGAPAVQAAAAARPVVAIHISELNQALESLPAAPQTPSGAGYTGYQWFIGAWHYFVIPEALKIALEADGTPYAVVTDADIADGALLENGAPRYPIVFSLAAEAVDDSEIQPLRDYVNAGGFLFVGSSAFTRHPDGASRGDFALAAEMGLHQASPALDNWTLNSAFTHLGSHRLTAHIPVGTVTWDMLTKADDVVWGQVGAQQMWQVTAGGAEVIATGSGRPLLATNPYGAGRFIYHAVLNPLVGAGGADAGMYAYTIYRSAIEWAFEASGLPLIKNSPWPYDYDAAFMVRHDLESNLQAIQEMEGSAHYEAMNGVKGDYYFCTGVVRSLDAAAQQPYIDHIRNAVINYGATVGSHNGGYPRPGLTDPSAYEYWHWGPDTVLDQTAFGAGYETYTNGYDYSKDSIRVSFEDIERWLAGADNGRSGCAAAGNCPRTWAAPYFNSGREGSQKMLAELGVMAVGEQKISPFPHGELSYDPAAPNHRFGQVALPTSDWFVGTTVAQSLEAHTDASIPAAVDFYYQKGYLINLYGHSGSNGGKEKAYLDYAVAKPRMWAVNAVGLYDWWKKRAALVVTPEYSLDGGTAVAAAAVSGAADQQAAVELALPHWSGAVTQNVEVRLNGEPASASEYRLTAYGVKVRVGTAVSRVEVRYRPVQAWVQADWTGGGGQARWSDAARFDSAVSADHQTAGQVSLALASPGELLFSDDFNRSAAPGDLSPWTVYTGSWTLTGGALRGTAGGIGNYANLYSYPTVLWTDTAVQARLQFASGAYGGGLAGRVDPATGARYAAWVLKGSSSLRLLKWSSWNSRATLAETAIAPVGEGWHALKLDFSGDRIRVYWDGRLAIDAQDSSSPYLCGGVGVEGYYQGGDDLIDVDDVEVRGPAQYETSGALISSGFDGGLGADWYALTWDGSTPEGASTCVRTRSAARADLLAAAAWSGCYPAGGSVAGPDQRWLQYRVELQTSDARVTPLLEEIRVTFLPGAYLPASILTYSGPTGGASQASVRLTAALANESAAPVAGRTVRFRLADLPEVSATTDGSGAASASLDMNLVPGSYSLTAAFDGDGVYAPADITTPFEVTDPWSEWIQDTPADFASGASSQVDTAAIPGSVVLARQMYGDTEENGSFPLAGGTWSYRHRLYIDNPNASELPSGYTFNLFLDTAGRISAGKMLANGNDARVVWTGGGAPLELDRLACSPFNASSTEICFKSQAAIPAGARDASYYLYFGNPTAGAPPADPKGVWALYDAFDGTAVDTTVWNRSGTITANGGWARLAAGASLFSKQPFLYGRVEMRVQAVTENNHTWWGWSDAVSDGPNFALFEEFPSPTNFTALLRSDGTPYQTLLVAEPSGGLTSAHTYEVEWRPGQARWRVDGSLAQSASSGVPDSPMNVVVNASSRVINVDWVRGRLLAAQEPEVALAWTYPGYAAQGTYTSAAWDTGGTSEWKYLVWDASQPAGTSLSLSVRAAMSRVGLESAEWVRYDQPGLMVTNPPGRWVQYRAALNSTDIQRTPELGRVTLYYATRYHPPAAADDRYTTGENTSLEVAAPGVLANDSDADGDELAAVSASGPAHGRLDLRTDGSFTYTPDSGYAGPDSFTYQASDGRERSPAATVQITVVPAPRPASFSGQVKLDGQPVPDGTVVQALIGGVVYASGETFTADGASLYRLDIPADDPSTPAVEGGREGDTIQFRINGKLTDQTAVWHDGATVVQDLTLIPYLMYLPVVRR